MQAYCPKCGDWSVPSPEEPCVDERNQVLPRVEALRNARDGSSDPLHPAVERVFVVEVMRRLNSWRVNFSRSLRYDEAVRATLIEGLLEWFEMAKDDLYCRKCAEESS